MLLAAASTALSEPPFSELAKLFENDAPPRPEIRMAPSGTRPGVEIFDYSFASPYPDERRVTLVVPSPRGRFPVILFGHWMMNGSPLRNRSEFRDEAFVLARAGAICLLLDTPLVRPGVVENSDPLKGQE